MLTCSNLKTNNIIEARKKARIRSSSDKSEF